jgi:hypothetical protein
MQKDRRSEVTGDRSVGLVSVRKRRARKVLARPDQGARLPGDCEEGATADTEGATQDTEEAHLLLQ